MRGMSRTRMGLNWLDLLVFNLSAHNVARVMLNRSLRESSTAAAYLHITSLCEPISITDQNYRHWYRFEQSTAMKSCCQNCADDDFEAGTDHLRCWSPLYHKPCNDKCQKPELYRLGYSVLSSGLCCYRLFANIFQYRVYMLPLFFPFKLNPHTQLSPKSRNT